MKEFESVVTECDVVILSDYGKGDLNILGNDPNSNF